MYTRKGKTIIDHDGKPTAYKYINEAKRVSRKLQAEGHTVRVKK